jgi:hypothetical protein
MSRSLRKQLRREQHKGEGEKFDSNYTVRKCASSHKHATFFGSCNNQRPHLYKNQINKVNDKLL